MRSEDIRYTYIDSPIGRLMLVRSARGLCRIEFENGSGHEPQWRRDDEAFDEVIGQLGEYFQKRRRRFDLRLDLQGTDFQVSAWRALQAIPYGQTRSYGEQARALGKPKAVRAVGAANGRNPLPIVVPCHRVIGKNGKLTGFAGGLDIKRKLLDLEQCQQLV